jgi:hypothetical protein
MLLFIDNEIQGNISETPTAHPRSTAGMPLLHQNQGSKGVSALDKAETPSLHRQSM